MAKQNMVCATFRLNMDNPQHVKINEVIKRLNPKIYKSKNQFLIEAALFYIEHYGEEDLAEAQFQNVPEYIQREDLEDIKTEMVAAAMTEARKEVIRILGGVISGMQAPAKGAVIIPDNTEITPDTSAEEDEVITGCALSWMMKEEGDEAE